MKRPRYTTTVPRALAGLVGGGALGAVLVALCLVILWIREAPLAHTGMLEVVIVASAAMLFYTYYAFIVFLLGLFAIACPLWFGLHLLGRRTFWDAIALGVVLMVGASLLWLTPSMTNALGAPAGWKSAVSATPMGALGAIVGSVIWRIAYRRAEATR